MIAKIDIQVLAEKAGIDCDTDGDIWGSTNGALTRFAAMVLEEAAKACDDENRRARYNMECDIPKNHEFWNGGAIFSDQLAEEIRALKPRGAG